MECEKEYLMPEREGKRIWNGDGTDEMRRSRTILSSCCCWSSGFDTWYSVVKLQDGDGTMT